MIVEGFADLYAQVMETGNERGPAVYKYSEINYGKLERR